MGHGVLLDEEELRVRRELSGRGVGVFAPTTPSSEDLHITAGSAAADQGVDLSASFTIDIDNGARSVAWDIGADDIVATTAVELLSFTATGSDASVLLEWETGSELDNLGFHLYRSMAEEGPYERLTASLIPGLGSSPAGARSRYRDTGVTNGVSYFYKLEDIETTGTTSLHGPVSATADASAASHGGDSGSGASDASSGDGASETDTAARIIYGEPVVELSAGVEAGKATAGLGAFDRRLLRHAAGRRDRASRDPGVSSFG